MSQTPIQRSRQYSSYSGADIRIVINGEYFGASQALSHAIQREKVPVYVLGSPDPLSFSRGKRGIAGTMVNLVLGQDPIYTEPFSNMKYLARKDEIFGAIKDINDASAGQASLTSVAEDEGSTFDPANLTSNYVAQHAFYMDQLPPFDAVVVAANEYGNAASMRILGIEILNQASGVSVDDSAIEQQSTYVAISIVGWKELSMGELQTALDT
jgi:hypothetical protein